MKKGSRGIFVDNLFDIRGVRVENVKINRYICGMKK